MVPLKERLIKFTRQISDEIEIRLPHARTLKQKTIEKLQDVSANKSKDAIEIALGIQQVGSNVGIQNEPKRKRSNRTRKSYHRKKKNNHSEMAR